MLANKKQRFVLLVPPGPAARISRTLCGLPVTTIHSRIYDRFTAGIADTNKYPYKFVLTVNTEPPDTMCAELAGRRGGLHRPADLST